MEPVLPNTPMRGWSILTTTENFIQQERPQCGGTLRPSMQDALAGRRSIKPLWSLTNTYSAGLFNCESDPCLQGATSVSGQPRHFDSAPRTSALLRSADIADRVRQVRCKSFFGGWRTKILRAADPFYARRREGPSCLIQNRSRISVVALKSDAAEKSKNQLSRDF
jgi:hypothetical protein